jgi:hypothetical protein
LWISQCNILPAWTLIKSDKYLSSYTFPIVQWGLHPQQNSKEGSGIYGSFVLISVGLTGGSDGISAVSL